MINNPEGEENSGTQNAKLILIIIRVHDERARDMMGSWEVAVDFIIPSKVTKHEARIRNGVCHYDGKLHDLWSTRSHDGIGSGENYYKGASSYCCCVHAHGYTC